MKKSREEIVNSILAALEERPLSIQQISDRVQSNWITVSEMLEKLKREGKVKEIISTDKIKFYQKITGDTYYNIPISENERKQFNYLFSAVIKEYKTQKNRLPNKTELAKSAVSVIENPKSELMLPTVWYLYGKIPLMICDPARDYSTDFVPENVGILKEIIKEVVSKHATMNTWELRHDQYSKHNQVLYNTKEHIINYKYDWDKNKEKILGLFNKLLVYCPTKSDHPEVFLLTERLVVIINKIALISSLNKHRIQILLSLDSLWKYIATYLLLDSLTQIAKYSNKREIMKFYLEKPLEVRKEFVEESLSNLESIYLSELTTKNIWLSEKAVSLREILSDLYED
jgi:hypothetical protein